MAQLQMDIRIPRGLGQRFPVGGGRFRKLPRILQHVPKLDPEVGPMGQQGDSLGIGGGGLPALPPVSKQIRGREERFGRGAIGPGAAAAATTRQQADQGRAPRPWDMRCPGSRFSQTEQSDQMSPSGRMGP